MNRGVGAADGLRCRLSRHFPSNQRRILTRVHYWPNDFFLRAARAEAAVLGSTMQAANPMIGSILRANGVTIGKTDFLGA